MFVATKQLCVMETIFFSVIVLVGIVLLWKIASMVARWIGQLIAFVVQLVFYSLLALCGAILVLGFNLQDTLRALLDWLAGISLPHLFAAAEGFAEQHAYPAAEGSGEGTPKGGDGDHPPAVG